MNKSYSWALVVLEEALVVLEEALVGEVGGWRSTLHSQKDFSKSSLRQKGLRKDRYLYIYIDIYIYIYIYMPILIL